MKNIEDTKQKLAMLHPGESPKIENITSEGKVIYITSHGRESLDLETITMAAKNYARNGMGMQTQRYIQ